MESFDLREVLTWLYVSGGSTTVLSFVLERSAWFQNRLSSEKEVIYVWSSVILSLLAYFTLTYVPTEIIDALTPIFNIVVGTIATALFGKLAHRFDTRKSPL